MTQVAAPVRDIVTWDELDRLVGKLAEQLAGRQFDVLLAITRGGMVPAGMLAYRLRLRDILVRGKGSAVVDVGSPIHAFSAVLDARFPAVPAGSSLGARSGERQAHRRRGPSHLR